MSDDSRRIPKFTFWHCGTNPSTLEVDKSINFGKGAYHEKDERSEERDGHDDSQEQVRGVFLS